MTVRPITAAAALFLLLGLAGCAGSPASGADAADCDVVGVAEGVDVEPFAVELADGEYPIRGNMSVGTADGGGVADVRVTVAGDGFSTVICSDAEGKWGAVLPAAAPYTVTIDDSTIPDGLAVIHPELDADSSTVVAEQLVYPATVNFFFEGTGDASNGEQQQQQAPAAASGTWGGHTFPGNVDGYRLISEAEYADFTAAYPGAIVCVYLGGPLSGESLVSDGTNMFKAPYSKALYTSSSESLVDQGCDSTKTIIDVTWTGHDNLGLFADASDDANGNHCVVVASNMCATLDPAGGNWTAADLSSKKPLDEVSNFLQAVRDGG